MKKYCLEIYEPRSKSDTIATFESDTPFMSVSKGDIMNTAFMNNAGPEKVIKVVEVMHILWDHNDGNDTKHKICIYTQE